MRVDHPSPNELPSRTGTAALAVTITALLIGCGGGEPPVVRAAERPAEPSAPAPSTVTAEKDPKEAGSLEDDGTTTILVSNSNKTFCDGSTMDSAGYRKTLTKEQRVQLPANDGTLAGKAKAVAVAAGGNCSDALKQIELTVQDGVVRIPPIPAWAGISIAMCTCKPEVEVNLLRIPGISKVIWEGPQL